MRAFLAICAVAVGVVIALHQKHFVLEVVHPGTFWGMLRHRCGMVLAGSVVWAVVECGLLVRQEPGWWKSGGTVVRRGGAGVGG